MAQRYLYVTVLVAVAAILAIGIVVTLVLGPFYRVNLFLWSAPDHGDLGRLECWLCGWRALGEPHDGDDPLYVVLVAASLWTLLIPFDQESHPRRCRTFHPAT